MPGELPGPTAPGSAPTRNEDASVAGCEAGDPRHVLSHRSLLERLRRPALGEEQSAVVCSSLLHRAVICRHADPFLHVDTCGSYARTSAPAWSSSSFPAISPLSGPRMWSHPIRWAFACVKICSFATPSRRHAHKASFRRTSHRVGRTFLWQNCGAPLRDCADPVLDTQGNRWELRCWLPSVPLRPALHLRQPSTLARCRGRWFVWRLRYGCTTTSSMSRQYSRIAAGH